MEIFVLGMLGHQLNVQQEHALKQLSQIQMQIVILGYQDVIKIQLQLAVFLLAQVLRLQQQQMQLVELLEKDA